MPSFRRSGCSGRIFALREEAYREALDCFSRFLTLTRQNCRRVDVPYLDTSLPALLIVPHKRGGDTPCMVHFDGLDVTKEIIYLVGVPGALAERGIATLVVDNPGVGESLRMRGLHNGPEAEIPAKAAVDFLQSTPGIDRDRIGIMALSLGGYHAPRVAAFEPRLKCAVAWGANYDWGETQRRRYESKDQRLPVPHYWDHVGWVFGKSSVEDVVAVSEKAFAQGHPASDQMPDSVHPRRERSPDFAEPGKAADRRLHRQAPRPSFTCRRWPTAAPSIAASITWRRRANSYATGSPRPSVEIQRELRRSPGKAGKILLQNARWGEDRGHRETAACRLGGPPPAMIKHLGDLAHRVMLR